MSQVIEQLLPDGWTRLSGSRQFDVTRVGRPGRWTHQQNDPYSVLHMEVSYLRSDFEQQDELRFDSIFAFFLTTGAAVGFLVDDVFDNTSDARNGSGIVTTINGVLRLAKVYDFNGATYTHPITRPRAGVVLGGGAAGGVLDLGTGIVTGAGPGTWVGGMYWPMIFSENGLKYERSVEGTVESVGVSLEEVLEF